MMVEFNTVLSIMVLSLIQFSLVCKNLTKSQYLTKTDTLILALLSEKPLPSYLLTLLFALKN